MKCIYLNARSILSEFKIDILREMCYKQKFDIVAVAETWLNEGVRDAEVHIEGYTMYRSDRKEVNKVRGGGLLLYVKNTIRSQPGEGGCLESNEYLSCKISHETSGELVVGVFYRAPNSGKEGEKVMFEAVARMSNRSCLLLGDFNYPEIDWTDSSNNQINNQFLEIVNDNFLFQHVTEPTRGKNILDLILTTEERLVENVKIREPLSTSDHNVLEFNLIFGGSSNKDNITNFNRMAKNYYKGNYKEINREIGIMSWEEAFANIGINEAWDFFLEFLTNLIDRYIKNKKVKNSNVNKPWYNKTLTKFAEKKTEAWLVYKSDESLENYEIYKINRNIYNNEIEKAKRNFENKIASECKTNPKLFYKYANSTLKVKEGIGDLIGEGGEIVSSDEMKCDLLNKYFSSVYNTENYSELPEPGVHVDGDMEMLDVVITESIVLGKLQCLDANKAPGVDNIANKFLIETASTIARPVTLLFNKSMDTGCLPKVWTQSNVTPIFKAGNRSDPSNYRPVSLTSVLCKILERIIKEHIVDFLSKYNILNDLQHGFVKNRSCLSNLLQYCDYVASNLDSHSAVDVIYLDFQKAFDKVPHQLLVHKIEAYGIKGKTLVWIKNWLGGRCQRVVISGSKSNWEPVGSGVPQGSVLGPILFTIFIDDLGLDILGKLLKFADDTKTFGVVDTLEDCWALQQDLDKLVAWSETWGMAFNAKKCKIMHFGRNNINFDYNIGNQTLVKVHEEKDLGILVSDNFKVAKQVERACCNANRTLGSIRRSFVSRDKDVILPLYKALVRPQLEYCVQAWRPYYQKDIDKLEAVQRRATKLIDGMKGLEYNERLKILKLPSLEQRRARGDLIEVFKIYKGWTNLKFDEFFCTADNNLRGHKLKLYKTRFNSDIGKNKFGNRVIDSWNKLPEDLLECSTLNAFKNGIDKWIVQTGLL